ncbi:uncharacterized protein J7T54_006661 [Emericellopsis cladophorae]|uniref:Uncharacterized protein n=1 Tax=Emericellopsis cladophorae TaxID=2686198 RepID=A0A9P9Y6Y9_9HYPO|nr:uncharacterized protein J7T54_006661 [Emericellopsis cladophorae]KAI6784616.1 hypothetical protein J7T54_006661 [Emericellopsis cladophorae]
MDSTMIFARNLIARAGAEEDEEKLNPTSIPGAIVGYVLGTLGGVFMLSVIGVCCIRSRRRRRQAKQHAAEKAANV